MGKCIGDEDSWRYEKRIGNSHCRRLTVDENKNEEPYMETVAITKEEIVIPR
jgi:hypothetical protein